MRKRRVSPALLSFGLVIGLMSAAIPAMARTREKTMKAACLAIAVLCCIASYKPAAANDAQKNMCLVYGTNCPSTLYTLPEKIRMLEAEVKKGREVYTEEELQKLERKLADEKFSLKSLMRPGKR